MNCSVCRKRKVVDGYIERVFYETVGKSRKVTTKMWCQECLTKYANKTVKFDSNYMPKLRDTDIDEYNAMISSDEFIAEAFKEASY